MNLDVNWHNAELQCEGGPRPDGSGLRVAFAGPQHADGRRLRLVFGVEAVREGRAGHDLPTNLTVIFEGEDRLFATRGDDHCTVDELRQERVGALGGPVRVLAHHRARLLHRPGEHAQQRRAHPGQQFRLRRHGGIRGRRCGPGALSAAGDPQDLTDLSRNMAHPTALTPLRTRSRCSRSWVPWPHRRRRAPRMPHRSTWRATRAPTSPSRQNKPARVHAFRVWVADTPQRAEQGLMFVSDLPESEGMVFPLEPPRVENMWMKNTYIELDMLFIAAGRARDQDHRAGAPAVARDPQLRDPGGRGAGTQGRRRRPARAQGRRSGQLEEARRLKPHPGGARARPPGRTGSVPCGFFFTRRVRILPPTGAP